MARFLDKGFDETTVEEVAREAGISRRTFFRYFPTKEAAFFADQQERLKRFVDLLQAVHPDESRNERVERACLEMAAVYMENRQMALAQHRATLASRTLIAYDQSLDTQWEDAVSEMFVEAAASARAGEMAWLQAAALLGVIRAALRRWFLDDCQTDLVQMGRDALEMLSTQTLLQKN